MMKSGSQKKPETFAQYIALQPPAFRACLRELHSLIKSTAPGAQEVISYQIPCFTYHYMLVGFGTTKKYCSLYTMSTTLLKEMKSELEGYDVSGTTLHFLPDQSLPTALIKKIVGIRMMQNEARAQAKKK